ncbi:3-hydroxyacyl-ACP dehydratase FabZ [Bacteroidales bacterium OttesenSCG-928-B11]|nr:3-hydroxyacyl-ACP dehydratase FabZ [Bacteroidales bacterium OttesenSCG-928-C03]MDL2312633.1 3-hydroxyacyl-ACP dehydratase FabZ [Bacteroidales bacterium OttesenSCG-928-B11]MDL2326103.1 3-hydroxyacyl-ACP dehydratase FabZ [Bacteroidales bacterium OttesenSCG-928-A14]
MNREQIKTILPHREPMLLVDAVEHVNENLVHAEYHIRGDEFFLQGHYPGNPVVPGVILCEIMAQSSCLLVAHELVNRTPLYAGIDKVRFKHPVKPGDTVHVYASVTNRRDLIFYVKAEAKVNGKTCVKGDLIFALIDNDTISQ